MDATLIATNSAYALIPLVVPNTESANSFHASSPSIFDKRPFGRAWLRRVMRIVRSFVMAGLLFRRLVEVAPSRLSLQAWLEQPGECRPHIDEDQHPHSRQMRRVFSKLTLEEVQALEALLEKIGKRAAALMLRRLS